MSLCLRHKGTFYFYRSDEKLTVTVGATLAVARYTSTWVVTIAVPRAGAEARPYSGNTFLRIIIYSFQLSTK